MKSAMLFGPFIGSLSWELYYFVPYMIYMKKHNPAYETIVYTRSERFDLYGTYGDILVPLRIKNDRNCIQHRFTINGLFITSGVFICSFNGKDSRVINQIIKSGLIFSIPSRIIRSFITDKLGYPRL